MVKELDLEIERLAAGQLSLFTLRQVQALEVSESATRHRLTTGRWIVHRPSIFRLVGGPVTKRVNLMAAVLAVPGSVASHHAAAALHGLPGFQVAPAVTVAGTALPRLRDVEVHRTLLLLDHHQRERDGIPCTSVARTIFDLCGSVHPRRAERALDNSLARRLVTLPALGRVFNDLAEHGRGGTVLMRELLEQRPIGYVAPESELEARFMELLDAFGLPQPTRQLDVGDSDAWIGRVDFVYRNAHLVVEVDGREGHSSLLDQLADADRDQRLDASGRMVLRFGWDDIVHRGRDAAAYLKAVLCDRTAVPASL